MAAEGEVTEDTLRIGDLIRFSVALLRDIYEHPNHASEVVKLVEIRLEPDGTKVLAVKKVEKER